MALSEEYLTATSTRFNLFFFFNLSQLILNKVSEYRQLLQIKLFIAKLCVYGTLADRWLRGYSGTLILLDERDIKTKLLAEPQAQTYGTLTDSSSPKRQNGVP